MIIGGGRQSYWQICSLEAKLTCILIVACSILATIVRNIVLLLCCSTSQHACIMMNNTTRKNEREHKPGTELQGIPTCSLLHQRLIRDQKDGDLIATSVTIYPSALCDWQASEFVFDLSILI
jgi:hypothetical protein